MPGLLSRIALLSLISILYLGSFSRFTHGQYTPSLYQYQIDRAADGDGAWVIPVADLVLGTLLLFARTRPWVGLLCATAQSYGVVTRVLEGKDVLKDMGMVLLAATVYRGS
jgi:hypothetical protein